MCAHVQMGSDAHVCVHGEEEDAGGFPLSLSTLSLFRRDLSQNLELTEFLVEHRA